MASDEKSPDYLPELQAFDRHRIQDRLKEIGGPDVVWGAASMLEVWLVEHQLRSQRLAARQLALATWVLAAATLALVFATVVLIIVTV